MKNDPNKSTAQVGTAAIKDAVSLTNIKAGATDASSATVRFALYSAATCIDPDPTNNVVGNRVVLL